MNRREIILDMYPDATIIEVNDTEDTVTFLQNSTTWFACFDKDGSIFGIYDATDIDDDQPEDYERDHKFY